MFVLYLPALLAVLATSLYYYFTRTFNYWKDRNVVGPTPVPFFGNIKESALRKKITGEVLKKVYDDYPNEKVVGIYRMTTPCLLIRDLDILKHIMIKDFDQFIDRGVDLGKEGLGANLFHSDGDTWKVLRNRFSPIFTSGKLKGMFYLINERGDKFVEYVTKECSQQQEQEVYSFVQKYTIATISACAFGMDIDLLTDKMEIFIEMEKKIFTLSLFNELDMMYPGILKYLNASLFPKSVTTFFFDLVRDIIAQRNGNPTNRKDFMDLIMELRQQKEVKGAKRNDGEDLYLEITDSVIAAQAFIFYAAGFETSATTITYMLYELAKNPEIQDKLIAEIDEVLERTSGELTYDSNNEMPYYNKVFDETLRLYPIVDPLQRCANTDYKLPGTDVTVKKGQIVLVPVISIHRDEKYYPNPQKFDPERFSSENSRDRHPCAYLPFGTGPRNCIGLRFAKVQSRVCIVKLLSKFRVQTCNKTQESIQFNPVRGVNGPLGGIHLNFVSRTNY